MILRWTRSYATQEFIETNGNEVKMTYCSKSTINSMSISMHLNNLTLNSLLLQKKFSSGTVLLRDSFILLTSYWATWLLFI